MKDKLKLLPKNSSLNHIHFSKQKQDEVMRKIEEREEKNAFYWIKPALSIATMAALLFIVVHFAFDSMDSTPIEEGQQKEPSQQAETSESESSKNNEEKIGKPPIEEHQKEFFEKLIQETDSEGKVLQYDTKEELVKDLNVYATEEVIEKLGGFLYEEKNGALYLREGSGPTGIDFNHDYQLEQLNKSTYRVSQVQESENGKERVTFIYDYRFGRWMITSHDFEPL